jgi:hypothetical protein
MIIEEGLFAQVVARSEEGSHLVSSDPIYGGIVTQEGLELAEDVGVISDSVRGETASVCVEKVAFKGLGEGDLVCHLGPPVSKAIRAIYRTHNFGV